MDKCRHSCCKGWEIDIDPETHAWYQTIGGEIGQELQKNIAVEDGVASFRLTEDERCPFLNEKGLCRLILTLGEDCLCQVCDDHPRFRSFFSDRTEIGLGLCCEGAGELMLRWQEPVHMQVMEDDGAQEPLPAEERELLAYREDLIQRVQDRSRSISARVAALSPETVDFAFWQKRLLELERLDDAWAETLALLTRPAPAALEEPEWDIALEQLLVYLFQRHLPSALDDGQPHLHAAYALLMWKVIRQLCAAQENPSVEGLIELCRLYSSEIEYSDENVAAILESLSKMP